MSTSTLPINYRLQLVAWIEANEQAAKRSPQSAQWSNGVAAGVKLALDLLDKQGMPDVAELIKAAEEVQADARILGMEIPRLVAALARVKGGAA